MKRMLPFFLCLCLMTGCSIAPKNTQSDKLQIVTTLFPQYDFARQIAGDLADVHLLLPPGAESHSYEPTPQDVIAINNADLFIYTGELMEAWVSPLLESLEGDPMVLDLSEGLDVLVSHAEHNHDADPHIFTSPRRALQLAQRIQDALCQIDPENASTYLDRGLNYRTQLKELDDRLQQIADNAKRKKLVFGGRFAFLYLVEEYGLSYAAAYDSCSSESEPSAADIAAIIEIVRAEQIPVVYYEELADPRTARLIAEETGAKLLLLHSCHNISKDELARGETYVSLMQTNFAHIEEGLN
ncbi:MAG: zinc ABC transporter substrate-binding protein [Ruminococcaceae bacterium]|nr:zinc ABC transporter substrate-binding protein [Oscillospiraceae bacterium]